MDIELVVDGRCQRLEVEPRELLGHVLRERLGCRGVHVACAIGVCGACTVLVDGEAVRSCLMLAVQTHQREVRTLRGVSSGGRPHPVEELMSRNGGVQCGYCTSGMVLGALSYLDENPAPSNDDITEAISGHVCRCTGYAGIVRAIADYAAHRTTGAAEKSNRGGA